MKVIRKYFYKELSIDDGALPCPRCRNKAIRTESHPATGQMATCGKCGARGPLKDWNDGLFYLQKKKSASTYEFIGEQKFQRPSSDRVVVA